MLSSFRRKNLDISQNFPRHTQNFVCVFHIVDACRILILSRCERKYCVCKMRERETSPPSPLICENCLFSQCVFSFFLVYNISSSPESSCCCCIEFEAFDEASIALFPPSRPSTPNARMLIQFSVEHFSELLYRLEMCDAMIYLWWCVFDVALRERERCRASRRWKDDDDVMCVDASQNAASMIEAW